MKQYQIFYLLAGFVACIGLAGYLRTGSPIPLLINGIIGLITIVAGWTLAKRYSGGRLFAVIWSFICTGLYTYMTFMPVEAHTNPRPGSKYMFGSMALFSLIALVSTVRNKQKQMRSE